MDTPTTTDPNQQLAAEEGEWRQKEEHIKELTYDEERKEKDAGIQHEEQELHQLHDYPLASLVQAGVIPAAKQQELAAANVFTLGELVAWVAEQQ